MEANSSEGARNLIEGLSKGLTSSKSASLSLKPAFCLCEFFPLKLASLYAWDGFLGFPSFESSRFFGGMASICFANLPS
jgi:hypothetical protein